LNESIRRLEEKIAYLERHVTEQDKAMLELAENIASLRREVKMLRARAPGGDTSAAGEGGEAGEDRPPHY